MSKVKKYGPYKGSKKNGGRPIYVFAHKENGHTVTTSSDKARVDYEDAHHEKLDRKTDVDHKDNGGRAGHDGLSNLQAMSHSKNVAKENHSRKGTKRKKK